MSNKICRKQTRTNSSHHFSLTHNKATEKQTVFSKQPEPHILIFDTLHNWVKIIMMIVNHPNTKPSSITYIALNYILKFLTSRVKWKQNSKNKVTLKGFPLTIESTWEDKHYHFPLGNDQFEPLLSYQDIGTGTQLMKTFLAVFFQWQM